MGLSGNITAMVTPLTWDNRVDEEKFLNLVEFQIAAGTDGILFLGGTGEYLALTRRERERVVHLAVDAAKGRTHVMVGNLEPGLGESISFGRFCKEAGADSTLVITPYYLHPTQEGIYQYYGAFCAQVDMPTLIYNFPAKTQVNILPATVARLAERYPQIIGIKECAGNLGQMIDLIHLLKGKIALLSGDETASLAHLLMGADGVIMATSNFIPQFWIALCDMIKNGKTQGATDSFLAHYDLFKAVYAELNPGPMKYALELIGKPAGFLSAPLTEPSEETKRRLRREMQKLSLIETA